MEKVKNMQPLSIYMESNPNPNSMKYVVNYDIVPADHTFDYPDVQSAINSPLALELFNFPFVDRVFFMNNFVTITKREDIEWFEIQNQLRDFLYGYLQENKPVVVNTEAAGPSTSQEPVGEEPNKPSTELEQKIITILDEYVKPAVEMDGGAITFDSFDNGILKLQLQGSCSGCPSSMVTLKSGIENLMKRMVPEVETVEAVEA